MLVDAVFWMLDIPTLYPIGAAMFFVFLLFCIAAIILWPLPPTDKE